MNKVLIETASLFTSGLRRRDLSQVPFAANVMLAGSFAPTLAGVGQVLQFLSGLAASVKDVQTKTCDEDDDSICLTWELSIFDQPEPIYVCGLFHITDGLITELYLQSLWKSDSHELIQPEEVSFRILTYHHFPLSEAGTIPSLESQCEYLKKNYNLISLTEAFRRLRAGECLSSNSLVITIDDGYRDCYLMAYPIFSSYDIPVTVFLTTDFLDGKCWLWVDQIRCLFARARAQNIDIEIAPGKRRCLDLSSAEKRGQAANLVKEAAKGITNAERLQLLAELPCLLQTDLPDKPPPEYAPLSWGDIHEMAAHGFDFGAHTKTHPILSSISDEALLREEVLGSKTRIEEELDRQVIHFCYPNGRPEDIGPDAIKVVSSGGFETALTTIRGLNYAKTDQYQLRRIAIEPEIPALALRHYTAVF